MRPSEVYTAWCRMWQQTLTLNVVTDEDPVGKVDEEEHDEGAEGRSGLGDHATPEINFTNVLVMATIPKSWIVLQLRKIIL